MKVILQRRSLFIRITASVTSILLLIAVFTVYQLHRAETGRSNCVPLVLRRVVAAREMRTANRARYEGERLREYTTAALLDGSDFPQAWSYLCDFYSKYNEWQTAKLPCEQSVKFGGNTANRTAKLGWVFENLKAYATAGQTYAKAADLDQADARLQERAVWMFLAAHRYDDALAAATKLLAHDHGLNHKRTDVLIGFTYQQLGKDAQANAAYARSFPDLRQYSCSLRDSGLMQIVCSGVSERNSQRVSNYWVSPPKVPPINKGY